MFNQTVAAVQYFWYSLCSENLLPLEDCEFISCVFLTSANDIMQLQEVVSLTLTFCLLAAILQPSLCVADKVYYVTPDSETTCPSTPCYNISHYIQNLSVYFQSTSMFKFLPGVHILDAGGVVVEFVNNIALTGDVTMVPSKFEVPFQPSSKVKCMGQSSSFVFMFVENLLIENLSFTNCGTPLSSNQSSALHFDDVTNLTISRVVVQNTTGFEIFGLSLRGDSRIFESALLYNHGDENREGGNVLLTLADCDSSRSSKSVSLHIWSTYFLHGDSPRLDFPTGLMVKILGNLCTNTYLILDNVTVSQNMNGNLGITLSYSDRSSVSVTIENSRFEGGTGGDYIRMDDSSQLQLQDCPYPQTSNQTRMLRIFNTTVSKKHWSIVVVTSVVNHVQRSAR